MKRRSRKIHVGIRLVEVQAGRDRRVPQHQQGLDQTRDAGRRNGVADIRLDAADGAAALAHGGRAASEGIDQGLHLDRIAERRAGAVRLDAADRRRVHAEAGPDGELQFALRREARPGEPRRTPVLVGAGAFDHAMDAVAVGHGASERFQHDGAHAFSGHEAIRGGVEGAAPPARREHARMAREHVHAGRGHQGDAAGHGQVALARSQRLAGEMHGDERGRAGGVHGDRGPAQVQVVSDPRGEDGADIAHAELSRQPRGTGHLGVVPVRAADEHRAGGAVQRAVRQPGILQRVPRGFQEQALLRIHDLRLGGGDAEETRVEAVNPFEEPAMLAVAAARLARLRIVDALQGKAVWRDLGDAVHAVAQVAPEGVEIGRAREAACHPYDGDRVGVDRGRREGGVDAAAPTPLAKSSASRVMLSARITVAASRARPSRAATRLATSTAPWWSSPNSMGPISGAISTASSDSTSANASRRTPRTGSVRGSSARAAAVGAGAGAGAAGGASRSVAASASRSAVAISVARRRGVG